MSRLNDLYTQITQQIIDQLETGVRPWLKPWNAQHAAGPISRPLRHNAIPYSGINILLLWSTAAERGYLSPYWLTFKQAKELGASVRKGEHSAPVVYASTFSKTEENKQGEAVARQIPFLKTYHVFNADQIDGLPEHYTALAGPQLDASSSHRDGGALLCPYRRGDPSRRESRLLQSHPGFHPDAALRDLQRSARATWPPLPMSLFIGQNTRRGWTGTSVASSRVMPGRRGKN